MAELVSPLAVGQRALVAGPPGAGATHLLRDMVRGLIGGEERVIVALIDVRPEEVPEWEISEEVEVHAAPSDRPPREQVALAELVAERGKRLAEQGEDVVVVLDSHHPPGPRLRAGAQPIGKRWAHAGAARRRGRQALVRVGARHRRGIADAARRRPRGLRVPPRDARARVAARRGRRGRAAGPGARRAGTAPGDRPAALAHAGRGGAGARGPARAAGRAAQRDALARSGRGLGVRVRARAARRLRTTELRARPRAGVIRAALPATPSDPAQRS